jgi:hypothetical protein
MKNYWRDADMTLLQWIFRIFRFSNNSSSGAVGKITSEK